jgi:hypothetical protein
VEQGAALLHWHQIMNLKKPVDEILDAGGNGIYHGFDPAVFLGALNTRRVANPA